MASIYKRKYTKTIDGKKIKKQSKNWYVKYRDADGIEQRVKGYKDKVATQQLAAKLEKESELGKEGARVTVPPAVAITGVPEGPAKSRP